MEEGEVKEDKESEIDASGGARGYTVTSVHPGSEQTTSGLDVSLHHLWHRESQSTPDYARRYCLIETSDEHRNERCEERP